MVTRKEMERRREKMYKKAAVRDNLKFAIGCGIVLFGIISMVFSAVLVGR